MRHRTLLLLALALLTSSIAVAQDRKASPASDYFISVSGSVVKGGYHLSTQFETTPEATALAGIVIWAEPMHLPIAVHENSLVSEELRRTLGFPEEALATTNGPLGNSYPSVGVPYEFSLATGISISFVLQSGKSIQIASVKVDISKFYFATDGREDFGSPSGLEAAWSPNPEGQWTWCCRCTVHSGCGTDVDCKDCSSSQFYCDCINCAKVVCCSPIPAPCP